MMDINVGTYYLVCKSNNVKVDITNYVIDTIQATNTDIDDNLQSKYDSRTLRLLNLPFTDFAGRTTNLWDYLLLNAIESNVSIRDHKDSVLIVLQCKNEYPYQAGKYGALFYVADTIEYKHSKSGAGEIVIECLDTTSLLDVEAPRDIFCYDGSDFYGSFKHSTRPVSPVYQMERAINRGFYSNSGDIDENKTIGMYRLARVINFIFPDIRLIGKRTSESTGEDTDAVLIGNGKRDLCFADNFLADQQSIAIYDNAGNRSTRSAQCDIKDLKAVSIEKGQNIREYIDEYLLSYGFYLTSGKGRGLDRGVSSFAYIRSMKALLRKNGEYYKDEKILLNDTLEKSDGQLVQFKRGEEKDTLVELDAGSVRYGDVMCAYDDLRPSLGGKYANPTSPHHLLAYIGTDKRSVDIVNANTSVIKNKIVSDNPVSFGNNAITLSASDTFDIFGTVNMASAYDYYMEDTNHTKITNALGNKYHIMRKRKRGGTDIDGTYYSTVNPYYIATGQQFSSSQTAIDYMYAYEAYKNIKKNTGLPVTENRVREIVEETQDEQEKKDDARNFILEGIERKRTAVRVDVGVACYDGEWQTAGSATVGLPKHNDVDEYRFSVKIPIYAVIKDSNTIRVFYRQNIELHSLKNTASGKGNDRTQRAMRESQICPYNRDLGDNAVEWNGRNPTGAGTTEDPKKSSVPRAILGFTDNVFEDKGSITVGEIDLEELLGFPELVGTDYDSASAGSVLRGKTGTDTKKGDFTTGFASTTGQSQILFQDITRDNDTWHRINIGLKARNGQFTLSVFLTTKIDFTTATGTKVQSFSYGYHEASNNHPFLNIGGDSYRPDRSVADFGFWVFCPGAKFTQNPLSPSDTVQQGTITKNKNQSTVNKPKEWYSLQVKGSGNKESEMPHSLHAGIMRIGRYGYRRNTETDPSSESIFSDFAENKNIQAQTLSKDGITDFRDEENLMYVVKSDTENEITAPDIEWRGKAIITRDGTDVSYTSYKRKNHKIIPVSCFDYKGQSVLKFWYKKYPFYVGNKTTVFERKDAGGHTGVTVDRTGTLFTGTFVERQSSSNYSSLTTTPSTDFIFPSHKALGAKDYSNMWKNFGYARYRAFPELILHANKKLEFETIGRIDTTYNRFVIVNKNEYVTTTYTVFVVSEKISGTHGEHEIAVGFYDASPNSGDGVQGISSKRYIYTAIVSEIETKRN